MDANLSLTNTYRWTEVGTLTCGSCNYIRVYYATYFSTTSASDYLGIYGGLTSASNLAILVSKDTSYAGVFDSHNGVRIPSQILWLNTATGFLCGQITYNTEL